MIKGPWESQFNCTTFENSCSRHEFQPTSEWIYLGSRWVSLKPHYMLDMKSVRVSSSLAPHENQAPFPEFVFKCFPDMLTGQSVHRAHLPSLWTKSSRIIDGNFSFHMRKSLYNRQKIQRIEHARCAKYAKMNSQRGMKKKKKTPGYRESQTIKTWNSVSYPADSRHSPPCYEGIQRSCFSSAVTAEGALGRAAVPRYS